MAATGANNRIEADHSRLKYRLRSMRGLRTDRTATVIITGLAFMQNLRRDHYALATGPHTRYKVAAGFTELDTPRRIWHSQRRNASYSLQACLALRPGRCG
jgi:hypothetical protein